MSSKQKARRRPQRASERNSNTPRLGWRLSEFSAATGVSRVTLWRLAKAEKLKLAFLGKIPIVTQAEAQRLGLLPPSSGTAT